MNRLATNHQHLMVFVPAFAAWPAALRGPAPPATLAQRPTKLTFHLGHSIPMYRPPSCQTHALP
jgi:hypothetical protein